MLAFFLDFFELAFIIIPLLGPVADKLGIDLIWFGVLLGVNMQTSFMHPPFGFALFYLRSVAPSKEYIDQVTGKLTEPLTTGQIYWGAIPFVVIQLVMVGARHRVPGAGARRARQRPEDRPQQGQDPDRDAAERPGRDRRRSSSSEEAAFGHEWKAPLEAGLSCSGLRRRLRRSGLFRHLVAAA